MAKAYSYIRFSTPEQAKGDSLRRQILLAEQYAEKNNLNLDEELNLRDLGVSAFKGNNVVTGRLGAFMRAIEEGKVQSGSYLLVENLDRLSRDKVTAAFRIFLDIIEAGIIIVTLHDERKYHKNSDAADIMFCVATYSRANEESAIKSSRKKSSWNSKIDSAFLRPVTKMLPAWLQMTEDRKIVIVPERVKLIKKIYRLALSGYGTYKILQEVEKAGHAPWGSSPSVKGDKRKPVKWHQSRIARILTDRAVIGEYQPKKSRGGLNVIPNYFPKVISEVDFYLVQKLRHERDVGNVAGRKGEKVTNIFSGLIKCGYSLHGFTSTRCSGNNSSAGIISKGRKSATRYLQCTRAKEGNLGCDECRKLFRYDLFERLFFEHITNIDFSVIFGKITKHRQQLETFKQKQNSKKGELFSVEKRISSYVSALENEDVTPKSILSKIVELELLQDNIKKEIADIDNDIKSLTHSLSLRKEHEVQAKQLFLSALNNQIKLTEEQRLKLSHIIQQNIDHIRLYSHGLHFSKQQLALETKIKKQMSTKAAQRYRYIFSTEEWTDGAAFIVFYKSGECRLVAVGTDSKGNLEKKMTVIPFEQ